MLIYGIGFLLCSLLIFYCGQKLSYYGDRIAELTGLGRAWIGLVLMASVTSLPELFVGISSSAIVQSADLAVGDVLGSCVFNLAILSFLDVLTRPSPLLGTASKNHILAATLGICLLSMVGVGLHLQYDTELLGWAGIISVIFVYLISVRLLYMYERQQIEEVVLPKTEPHPTNKLALKKAVLNYVGNAIIVIGAALFLPGFADHIANETGLGTTFIGTLLLAASTSLPEVAVSLAAVRMGAIDLSIGNLLGSNIFNILILSIDDIFYTKGNLLEDASDNNVISVFSVIIMSAIAIIGLTFHSKRKKFFLAADTFVILLIYIFNMIMLYKLR